MQIKRYANHIALVTVLLLIGQFLLAQTAKITGRITDESNRPVVSASVKVIGINAGTSTDLEGKFTLTLATGKKFEIEITAIGFVSKTLTDVEVSASQTNELNITLSAKLNNLQSVTVKTSARKETTNSLIQFQKNTNAVAQVISAEAI
ncbi:MAG TPA: carboxypeptidase regulatory-like domain-containing protein, partial [Panacibacter sp.]|nr:carboxypeptidase regulatory-like domain-containing protein [Panacibacter sp.]